MVHRNIEVRRVIHQCWKPVLQKKQHTVHPFEHDPYIKKHPRLISDKCSADRPTDPKDRLLYLPKQHFRVTFATNT